MSQAAAIDQPTPWKVQCQVLVNRPVTKRIERGKSRAQFSGRGRLEQPESLLVELGIGFLVAQVDLGRHPGVGVIGATQSRDDRSHAALVASPTSHHVLGPAGVIGIGMGE